MGQNSSMYVEDDPSDVIAYIRDGYHAFVGCNDPERRDSFVESLQIALDGELQECVFGSGISTHEEFATQVVGVCLRLVAALGVPFLERRPSIATSLEEAMQLYRDRRRQGYLILGDMDRVIEMQRTFEFEGPLRSVMQLYDDVAVVIVASNDIINGIVGDYERPFYMSFRVFRL